MEIDQEEEVMESIEVGVVPMTLQEEAEETVEAKEAEVVVIEDQ